jgi:16S rRNA (uracil1498-N3)-methyltransferase
VEPVAGGAPSSWLLRHAAALAYVDDLEAPVLRADDARHLAVVLRLRPGEIVVASDGAGSYRGCRVSFSGQGLRAASGDGAAPARHAGSRRDLGKVISLVPDTEVVTMGRAVPGITVGFSLAKADRTDWAVAKLAELGVDRILPLVCERTVAHLEEAAGAKRTNRLRRIAREASMLARRVWLPEVDEPLPLAEALAGLRPDPSAEPALTMAPENPGMSASQGGSASGGVALAEPGGAPLSLATPIVLVGPEGGWSPQELAEGLGTVHLGDTILRVETAAVVAGALLTGLRSGIVRPTAASPHGADA